MLVRHNLSNIVEVVREVKNTGNGKSLPLSSWKAFGIHHVFFSLEKEVYLLNEEWRGECTEVLIFVFEETFNMPHDTASIFDLLSLQGFSHYCNNEIKSAMCHIENSKRHTLTVKVLIRCLTNLESNKKKKESLSLSLVHFKWPWQK